MDGGKVGITVVSGIGFRLVFLIHRYVFVVLILQREPCGSVICVCFRWENAGFSRVHSQEYHHLFRQSLLAFVGGMNILHVASPIE